MAIPISNVTRRAVYAPSGAGGAGPYAFTFEILANTDIAVYKDDTLLTLTTHYTVSIASNGTGSVTITAAGLALSPVSPTQYAIVGNRTIARATDFTTGGDFFANTLNDELDQQTIFAQQNAEGIQRALVAPQTDPTTIDMTLPRAADRANKTLSFDANGDPTLGISAADVANAATYATNAANSATAAASSASAASSSASSASGSASTASTQASNASTSASNASTSASNASTSATNAAASASTASTQASNASTSASNASTSASNASTSASAASASASSANTAKVAAEAARDSALAAYDNFDDRYLGPYASNPALDNDGNALLAGALYFNTVVPEMRLWTGSAWVAAYVSGTGFLASANNLSDVASTSTARTNLGLGTGDSPQFTAINVGNASDTTVTRASAGVIAVEGSNVLLASNIGASVQAYSSELQGISQGGNIGMKNRIINGAMVIDQRNAGASVTPTADSTYTLDRWKIRNGGGAGRFSVIQSSTSAANFPTSVLLTVTTTSAPSGVEVYGFEQDMEGYNMADFGWGTANAQAVTLSFQVRSSLTGTYCISIRNSAADRSYVAEFTINSANTFETKTITVPAITTGTWLSTNGAGLLFLVCLGSGSTREGTAGSWQSSNIVATSNQVDWINTSGATFYITGVQLEKGSTATSFDVRPYGTELALCQRYFELGSFVSATAINTGGIYPTISFKVTKRSAAASCTVTNSRSLTLSVLNDASSNGYATSLYQNSNDSASSLNYFTVASEL